LVKFYKTSIRYVILVYLLVVLLIMWLKISLNNLRIDLILINFWGAFIIGF